MVIVVLGLYVTESTGSASQVGLVLAAYAAPLVVFLLVGGVVADRLPRRAVMVATDLVRAVLHGGLALLIAFDAVAIWHMVVIGIAVRRGGGVLPPGLHRPAAADRARGRTSSRRRRSTSASRETAIIAGPALGTALVSAWARRRRSRWTP